MPLKIDRLDPAAMFASGKYHHRNRWFPGCGFPSGGIGPPAGFPADNSAVWAGFSNYDDGGTICYDSIDWVFRGGVQFDLDWFQLWFGKDRYLLLTAVLEFWQQAPQGDCATSLLLANGDWRHGTLDDYLIPADSSDYIDTILPVSAAPDGGLSGMIMIRMNVTDVVLRWLSGDRPNYGFCFLGSDESMTERSNAECLNQFGKFKLEMTYLTVPGAAGHAAATPVQPRIPAPSNRRTYSMVGGILPAPLAERLQRPMPTPQRRPNQMPNPYGTPPKPTTR